MQADQVTIEAVKRELSGKRLSLHRFSKETSAWEEQEDEA
jgi:hypothetical protein